MKQFNDYILITGGTTGTGFQLAKLFAEREHNLIIVAQDPDALDRTKRELLVPGIDIITIVKDLFQIAAPFELYEEIVSRNLNVNILINDAGADQTGLFAETAIGRDLSAIQLNVSALVMLTQLFVHDMIKKEDGKILNLSSVVANSSDTWQPVFLAANAFIQTFTDNISAEVIHKGVFIKALLPFLMNSNTREKEEVYGEILSHQQLAKAGYSALMAESYEITQKTKDPLTAILGRIPPETSNDMMTAV